MADAVRLTCAACGTQWAVPPKPDGTMPIGARCPKDRGGCGKMRKIPRQFAQDASPPAGTWGPPSQPRAPHQTEEQCPDCSAPLTASPRGTIRACLKCRKRVIPAGVLAPYRRGQDTTRTVATQRERDLEAIALAKRKGVMLAQLGALADHPRFDPASLPVIDWFRDQVKDARADGRLDELAALLPEAGIRRRHWWQGRPAAIEPPPYDDEGQDYEDDEDADELEADDGAGAAPAMLATPASIAAQQHRAQPGPMTWADALAACGWRISPVIGGCQITDHGQLCGAGTAHHVATATGAGGWVCSQHYAALCQVITQDHYRRSA